MLAEDLSISPLLDRSPSTLSGGELQRIALARTLIQEPEILLLDEPLASVDTIIKKELRDLLRHIHRQGRCIVHVTHDYEEALALGTKIGIVYNGEIIQTGTPEDVFHHPRSEFVAHFIGARNYFRVALERTEDTIVAVTEDGLRIHLQTDSLSHEGFILIRSEDIILSNSRAETSAINNFEGTITDCVKTRSGMEVRVNIGPDIYAIITKGSSESLGISTGKKIWISFKATAVRFIES
jgi:molybdopterin-binding protein